MAKDDLLDELKKTQTISLRVNDKDLDMIHDIRYQIFYENGINYNYSEILRMALKGMYKQIKK